VLPDAEGLCARATADCESPETMLYNVMSCSGYPEPEVYEEREYRCFGQWEENGLVYTYAERVDLPGNECFVGRELGADSSVVTEAGANCERGHRPEKYGMTLKREGKCPAPSPAYPSTPTRPSLRGSEREDRIPMPPPGIEVPRSREDERRVNPRFRDSSVSGHRSHSHRRRNHPPRTVNSDRDIITNEIPGSAGRSASSSSSLRPLLAVLAALLASTCLAVRTM